MPTKFLPWIDTAILSGAAQNVLKYTDFLHDGERENGFKPRTPASSLRMNTALRGASLVTAAFMDIVAPDAALDASSAVEDVKTAISAYFNNNFVTADALAARGTRYGVCDTTAATVAKTVTVSGIFEQFVGEIIGVKFTNGNSATDATLNVNENGAKPIISQYGAFVPAYAIPAAYTALLQYTGAAWVLLNPALPVKQRQIPADALNVTYTGTMTTRDIIDAYGTKYKLYELSTSGTLTFDKPTKAEFCAVGGGGNGGNGQGTISEHQYSKGYGGAGGAGAYMKNAEIFGKSFTVTIAAAEEATIVVDPDTSIERMNTGKVGSIASKADESSSTNGGTGGGDGGTSIAGTGSRGDGLPKYVFGDKSVYDYPICAGGGGGLSATNFAGGNGGTNGGNGGTRPEDGGQGGTQGGGHGGRVIGGGRVHNPDSDGADATTYGSGGGGGAGSPNNTNPGHGGAGKGGVVFIRIPY